MIEIKNINDFVHHLIYEGQFMALLLSDKFEENGIHFFTKDDYSQQLAYMRHSAGKVISPHVHNPVPRSVEYTQEVLFIKKGKLRVDFYTPSREYIGSWTISTGDVLLLATGGHGFEVLEELEMIEVKQGPYAGDKDKTRFVGISNDQVKELRGK
jgi:mannose-6-phosphate isomerase-like protein (cupin superfamily)